MLPLRFSWLLVLAVLAYGAHFAQGEDAGDRCDGWRILSNGFIEPFYLAQPAQGLVVAVVDRDGIVTEVWHGSVSVGQRIALADEISPNGRISIGRSVELPAHKREALRSSSRAIVCWQQHDGSFRWLHGFSECNVFWITDREVFAFDDSGSRDCLVSLPRFVADSRRLEVEDFDHGPRMTRSHLRSRLIEFAVRAERQREHFQEVANAKTMDEYLNAIVPYRCEYGRCEFALKPSRPWSDETPTLIASMALSPHYHEAYALLAVVGEYENRGILKEIVANHLPKVSTGQVEALDTEISLLMRSGSSVEWAVCEATDRNLLSPHWRGFRSEPQEIGWARLKGLAGRRWVDRSEFSRTLVLHQVAYPAVSDVPEAQTALLAEWAELLAEDGPLAKKLDKDIPFAQKFLGYQAGAYLMKFRRPKDAAPVEPAAKVKESGSVEQAQAPAAQEPQPSQWPMFGGLFTGLALGAVFGRWSNRRTCAVGSESSSQIP